MIDRFCFAFTLTFCTGALCVAISNCKPIIKLSSTQQFMRESKGGGRVSGFTEKSLSYQASIQCWAIIHQPAKRHLNSETMFRWRADYSPLSVLLESSPLTTPLPKTKQKKQRCQIGTSCQNFLGPHIQLNSPPAFS